MTKPSFGVILPAAGSSSRFAAAISKVFLPLQGREVWQWSADVFLQLPNVNCVVVVVSVAEYDSFCQRHSAFLTDSRLKVVTGGATRTESVRNGLSALPIDVDFVAVHDAARPLITVAGIQSFFQQAIQYDACIPGLPVASTVKRIDESGSVIATIDRHSLRLAQTPQVIRRDRLQDAYQTQPDLTKMTDEAALIESTRGQVVVVDGWAENLKLTTQADLQLALALLKQREQ